MANAAPLKSNFNAGEWSPLMEGRVDITKYAASMRVCENFVPLVQGALTRRPGTKYVAGVKDNGAKVRLVPFEFSTVQAYVIEFGDLYCRFYMNRGQILSGGSPYEVSTPFTEAELFELKFAQSADVLYIVHPSHPPMILGRAGHTSWTLTELEFEDGPYLPGNTTSTTITPSATTGTGITLTASAATFAASDVGRLVRLKHGSTWGYAEITAYTSTTVVDADVRSDFGSVSATADWRLGLYGTANGYPGAVTFFGDRLVFSGPPAYPQRVDGSVVGDYTNFAPSSTSAVVADDSAISYSLNANDVNVIRWLADDERGLFIGTVGGEWIMRPSSSGEALTPTNVKATRSTAFGSANIMPLRADRAVLFVQKSARKLRELAYVYTEDGFRAPDMTVMAEHITLGGIVDMAYQSQPQSLVWAVRADGTLLGFTYERDQEVLGWHRHTLGGTDTVVESVAVIPTPDGTSDELWLSVQRTIDGQTVRYVEYMTPFWTGELGQEEAFFVDCGLSYSGSAATVISGLDHLEGETVTILADGAAHPDKVVASGSVTLDRAASDVQIGLGYISRGMTQRFEAGAANGTAQGKTKRIMRVAFRFWQSLGFRFGPDFDHMDEMLFRRTTDAMSAAIPLYTGDKSEGFRGDYETDGCVAFECRQPFPLTLSMIAPMMDTQDRR